MKYFCNILPVLALALLVTLVGCSRKTAFEEYFEIPEGGWHQNNPAIFEISLQDTLQAYNLLFHIRHDVNYKYRNLWVFADIEYPNGNITRDTIEFIIGDNSGNWLGDGLGKIKENHILLSNNIRFRLAGNYRFAFQQAMREEDQVLEHIHDVGLSVVKYE